MGQKRYQNAPLRKGKKQMLQKVSEGGKKKMR